MLSGTGRGKCSCFRARPLTAARNDLLLETPSDSCFRAHLGRPTRAFGHALHAPHVLLGTARQTNRGISSEKGSRIAPRAFGHGETPSGTAQLGPRSAPHVPRLINRRSSKIRPKERPIIRPLDGVPVTPPKAACACTRASGQAAAPVPASSELRSPL